MKLRRAARRVIVCRLGEREGIVFVVPGTRIEAPRAASLAFMRAMLHRPAGTTVLPSEYGLEILRAPHVRVVAGKGRRRRGVRRT